MAFSSKMFPGEPIINDSSTEDATAPPPGMGRGLRLELRGPEGYGDLASAFPSELLIPDSEVQARIQELEEQKSNLSNIGDTANLPPLNQGQTNYCWGNGPVYCVQLIRVIQNQELVLLSPASVCAPIKNFKNQGGWGKEALEYIIEHGIVPVSKWPANSMDRKYWTEENKKLALNYRVTEWMELKPRSKQELISCMLRRIPVAVGYNHWSHEVSAVDAVWLDGTVALRIRNSWGDWGVNGYGILQGSKMLPDDAVAPLVTMAS